MVSFNIILVTFNNNKLQELKTLFSDLNCNIKGIRDVVDYDLNIIEDGSSFEENAIKKVSAVPELKNSIIIADDSGLCLDALGGAPGILSARWAGPDASDYDLCDKVLCELKNNKNRNASFFCSIAIRYPFLNNYQENPIETVNGLVNGSIDFKPNGDRGFGYDSIFIPSGYNITFAEMPYSQKNQLSHRYLAFKKAKKKIETFLAKMSKTN